MKLHLPKKFQTALMAAIATVSFSTVSTATLAAAAFTFAGYQAAAEETADAPELTSEEKEAEEKLNEEMEDSIQAQEEEEKEESKLTTNAIDWDVVKRRGSQFERGGDGASHQLAQQAYAAMEAEVFTPEAAAAPQQQATATSGELPSDDLGFTTSPYATGSAANSGPVFEVTPAAPAADFLQDSPAENQGSGSTSATTTPAPVSASGFGGGAAGGYSPSGYAAPAARPLSVSVAPTVLASTGSSFSLDLPLLGAADGTNANAGDTPTWGVKFNGVEIPFQQQAYVFEYNPSIATNTVEFNPALESVAVQVPVIFSLPQGTEAASFSMIGNGSSQDITYNAPISGYGAHVTLTTANDAQEKTQFISAAQAAFGSLTVDNAKLILQNQVGITDDFIINQNGEVQLEQGSTLLLTQRIVNDGLFRIQGTVDASNLTHEEARELGIVFEDVSGKHDETVNSGFLYGEPEQQWQINKGGSGTIVSDGGKLKVGTLYFDIENGGAVKHERTDYSVWFQNEGQVSFSDVLERAQAKGEQAPKMVINGGDTHKIEDLTTVIIDVQAYDQCMIYVAQNTGAKISFVDRDFSMGGIGTFYAVDNSFTQISSFYGVGGRMNMANFLGQNIVIQAVDDLGYEMEDFSPLSMVVNSASSVKIDADIRPGYGYFVGHDIGNDLDYIIGKYDINGTLELSSGRTFDISSGFNEPGKYCSGDVNGQTVSNAVFDERLIHLNVGAQGNVLLDYEANNGAKFIADTFNDMFEGEPLQLKNGNVDTELKSAETIIPQDEQNPVFNAKEKYELSGSVEIVGTNASAGSTITADPEAGFYTTRNSLYTVSNADIYFKDQTADSTLSNRLVNDSVYNYTSGKKITLDNDLDDTVSLREVEASGGDIAITNKDNADTQKVLIGEGKTVSVTNQIDDFVCKGSLTVNELLQADGTGSDSGGTGASKIDANLELAVSATLDVHAAQGQGGINMLNNLVTLQADTTRKSGALTLSNADYSNLWAMEIGEKYDLFYNVSLFVLGEEYFDEAVTIEDLSSINPALNGYFTLCYSSGSEEGGRGENVGTIYLVKTLPEPTTGTLSLLALAALAARRRRKG